MGIGDLGYSQKFFNMLDLVKGRACYASQLRAPAKDFSACRKAPATLRACKISCLHYELQFLSVDLCPVMSSNGLGRLPPGPGHNTKETLGKVAITGVTRKEVKSQIVPIKMFMAQTLHRWS